MLEEFFSYIDEHAEASGAKDWGAYLNQRYVTTNKPV